MCNVNIEVILLYQFHCCNGHMFIIINYNQIFSADTAIFLFFSVAFSSKLSNIECDCEFIWFTNK